MFLTHMHVPTFLNFWTMMEGRTNYLHSLLHKRQQEGMQTQKMIHYKAILLVLCFVYAI